MLTAIANRSEGFAQDDGTNTPEAIGMLWASAGCASYEALLSGALRDPSPRVCSRRACVTFYNYRLQYTRLAAAAFALLPLVRAIIRPSATFLREEGLRV